MANLSFKSLEYREGYQAYLDGVDANPYDDAHESNEWDEGWQDCKVECAIED